VDIVHPLRSIANELFFELVRIVAQDIPPDEPRTRRAERVNGTQITRPIDDHRVAWIDQATSEKIQTLLRTGKKQHVFGLRAEPPGDGIAECRKPFGASVSPDGSTVAPQHSIDRASKRLFRKTLQCGHAGSH
jgi:hypothetical protein